MTPVICFVAPTLPQTELDRILRPGSVLDEGYPYWLGGPINWVLQSYLVLRQHRPDFSIGTAPEPGAINIAHVVGWRRIGLRRGEFRVSIRADYRRLHDVDFEILQNPSVPLSDRQAYVTYWPLPGLLPRSADRTGVESVAYAGRSGERNVAATLRDLDGNLGGLRFHHIEKERWHDMREVDVLIAIRDFSRQTFEEKPPSKLINAWHAGIPLIAGYDSAFAEIGTPGVDYVRVGTPAELRDALARLREDPDYYSGLVDAGRHAGRNYTREAIANQWLELIEGPIDEARERAVRGGSIHRMACASNRLLDRALDWASSLKNAGL